MKQAIQNYWSTEWTEITPGFPLRFGMTFNQHHLLRPATTLGKLHAKALLRVDSKACRRGYLTQLEKADFRTGVAASSTRQLRCSGCFYNKYHDFVSEDAYVPMAPGMAARTQVNNASSGR